MLPVPVHETEVASVPVSVPWLGADRRLLAEVGFKSRVSGETTMLSSAAPGSDCAPIIP